MSEGLTISIKEVLRANQSLGPETVEILKGGMWLTAEEIQTAKGGIGSLRWVLNNVHNRDTADFKAYVDSAHRDSEEALAVLTFDVNTPEGGDPEGYH